MKRVLLLTLSVCVVAAVVAVAAPRAHAYGNTAIAQATESLNCNNPTFPICAPPPNGFGLGGTWQWWEFDTGFTGDATVAFCGHDRAGSGGAIGLRIEINNWTYGPAQPGDVDFPGGVNYYVTSADVTAYGQTVEDVPWGDTGIPILPGHYSFHPAPGVAGEVQVTNIPH